MVEITREIDGAPDFELGLPRTAPVQYDITWPQEGEAPGLVLVIAGFGGDTAKGYGQALRRHIVETTGMAAVSVRYHAFHARPENGAAVRISPREHAYLIGEAAMRGAPVKDYSNLTSLAKGLMAVKAQVRARVEADPPHGEYQNFGVVARGLHRPPDRQIRTLDAGGGDRQLVLRPAADVVPGDRRDA